MLDASGLPGAPAIRTVLGAIPVQEIRRSLNMTVERAVFAVAGLIVLLSLALGYFVSPYWFLLTAFVGLSLVQSAFTGVCPAKNILRRCGLKSHNAAGH